MLKFKRKREKKNALDTSRVLVQHFCLFEQFCSMTKALKGSDTTSWESNPQVLNSRQCTTENVYVRSANSKPLVTRL